MSDLIEVAKRAIALMDLTTLNDDDTVDSVQALCQQAKTPADISTAAVCIYPRFIETAKQTLQSIQASGEVKVATVTNFPHGSSDVETAVKETQESIALGADEVDVVFPYQALIQGDEQIGYELVRQCKAACAGRLLKVIIEVGELKEESLIKKASEISIKAGADFIKTSTGKVAVNATPEYARMMLEVIRDLGVQDRVGFKAAGGVRTAEEAKIYLDMADEMMGRDWVTSAHYRFGASSLLANLLATLGYEKAKATKGNY